MAGHEFEMRARDGRVVVMDGAVQDFDHPDNSEWKLRNVGLKVEGSASGQAPIALRAEVRGLMYFDKFDFYYRPTANAVIGEEQTYMSRYVFANVGLNFLVF